VDWQLARISPEQKGQSYVGVQAVNEAAGRRVALGHDPPRRMPLRLDATNVHRIHQFVIANQKDVRNGRRATITNKEHVEAGQGGI